MNVELTDSQIYTLYETVVNNIEDLSYKYKDITTGKIKRACKSDKYQYKWDELHVLRKLLYNLIDWDKPSSNTDMCEVSK